MIIGKSKRELEKMRAAGQLVAHLLDRRTDFHPRNLCLFIAVCNSAAIEIVRGKLHQNTIARKNANEMFPHFS